MYVYIQSEKNIWTVGFYSPDGQWQAESDYDIKKVAAQRTAWLNGSSRTWFMVSALMIRNDH